MEDKLSEIENRLQRLEEENIETSNILYELMNSIDSLDRKINKKDYTLKHFTLGDA